jgi:hypothetical protein
MTRVDYKYDRAAVERFMIEVLESSLFQFLAFLEGECGSPLEAEWTALSPWEQRSAVIDLHQRAGVLIRVQGDRYQNLARPFVVGMRVAGDEEEPR